MFVKFCLLAQFALSSNASSVSIPYEFMTDEFRKEYAKSVREECLVESGANIGLLLKNQTEPRDLIRIYSCYGACVMKGFCVMRADGTWNVEVAIARIDRDHPEEKKETLKQAARICGTIKAADDCDTYYEIAKCTADYLDTHLKKYSFFNTRFNKITEYP